jgi:hypothetical protein
MGRLTDETTVSYDASTCKTKACTRPSDCGTGCRCIARQQSVALSLTGLIASCGLVLSTHRGHKLGGRGLSMEEPCACNSTYVSAACCQSDDGMVWESAEMKLGELQVALNV